MRRLTFVVLGAFVMIAGAAGCGGSKGGGAGGGGGHADAATDGPDGASDTGLASDAAGAGGTSDAATGDVTVDGALDAPATADAPADAADAATEVAPIDAGADCIAPTGEAPLSAAAEGLPASGLVLWLRGDRGVYKTAASAVCAWADESGNNQLLTSGEARPTWTSTGLGGQAAIHFTAAGQQVGTGSLLGLGATSARTFIAVSMLVATTQRFEPIIQGQIGSPGTYLEIDENTFDTAGSREGVYAMNNAYDATLATAATPRIHVYTLPTMTPGTPILPAIDYRVNGATQTLTRTPGGLGNGNFEDFSGANFTSVGSTAEGIIAEVLIYNRALTVDERTAVETALKARYGIP